MSARPQREESGLRKPLESLRSILIPAESLDAWAVQRRIFSLFHRRVLVAATSGRLVWITRKLLGGFDVLNIRWQDLEDVTLKVGMLGANLLVRAGVSADFASEGSSGSRLYRFTGLRKAQAQAVYRICQAQDQAWREKRRIRELEELRARSGGFPMPSVAGLAAGAATGPGAGDGAGAGSGGVGHQPVSGAVRRLQEAKKLLDEQLITDSEYEAIKARILSSG